MDELQQELENARDDAAHYEAELEKAMDQINMLEAKVAEMRQLLYNAHETLIYTSKWHKCTPLGKDIEKVLN